MSGSLTSLKELLAQVSDPKADTDYIEFFCGDDGASDEKTTRRDEAQQAHYRRMIASRPEWSLAGIFADEGITGTSAKKRPQFLEMIILKMRSWYTLRPA